jgi:hypothetical protein
MAHQPSFKVIVVEFAPIQIFNTALALLATLCIDYQLDGKTDFTKLVRFSNSSSATFQV